MQNNYDSIDKIFEKSISQLQEHLHQLAHQEKINDHFIVLQNHIIEVLTGHQHLIRSFIDSLQWEFVETNTNQEKEIKHLIKIQESLEAICIIHGIIDFPIWMRKGNRYLVNEAIYGGKRKVITLPYLLKNKFDRLPQKEKEYITKVLYY